MNVDNIGNVYACGYHSDSIVLFKFDQSGQLLWRKNYKYPGSQSSIGSNIGDIEISANNEIYLYGRTYLSGTNGDALLIKIDGQGNLIWQLAYNSIYNQLDYFTSIVISNDNYIYAVGDLADSQSVNRGLVIKYDQSGNIVWTSIKKEYSIRDAVIDNVNNIYVSAYIYHSPAERGAGIVKYNKYGNVIWSKYYNPGTGIGISAQDIFFNNCNGIYVSYLVFKPNELSYSGITKYNTNGHTQWNYIRNGIIHDTSYGTGRHLMIPGDNNDVYIATSGVNNPRLNDFHTIKYTETHYSISGFVTYKDNNQPVPGGYVKALYYDESTASIITVDSSVIQSDGRYTLTKIPPDSLDLMFYQDDDLQQFVPTYYVSTIDWREATKIYATQNLTNINCQVYRITGSLNPYTLSGLTLQNPIQGTIYNLKDVIVYAKIGDEFKNYGISGDNGSYTVTKLGAGNYTLIAHRMGFEPKTLNRTITNSSLNNVNFIFAHPLGIQPLNGNIPSRFLLNQNYPNPFNPVTTIQFSIPKDGLVKLTIFDVLGRVVSVLVNESLKPGRYNASWNAENFSSGIYFYRIETAEFTQTKKMMLLK